MISSLGAVKKWGVAARTFALPASTIPVLLGTTAAVLVGGAKFRPGLFLAALLAMALLHTGANLLNDVMDYRKGLDREVHPGSGAIVRGYLTERQVFRGAAILFSLGSLIGLWLTWRVGWPLFWIGLAGVLLGMGYSGGPAFKFHGLGDLVVFLDFGVLGALGAWTVQTGRPSWLPVLWALPISLLVVGILHANNWRDLSTDRERMGLFTVAARLGDRGSLIYYGVLIFAPFFLVFVLAGTGFFPVGRPWSLPGTAALVWLSLPMAIMCWRRALRRTDFAALDAATAQLNLMFGLLLTAGLGLARLLELGL